jgi:hypothetical protein
MRDPGRRWWRPGARQRVGGRRSAWWGTFGAPVERRRRAGQSAASRVYGAAAWGLPTGSMVRAIVGNEMGEGARACGLEAGGFF